MGRQKKRNVQGTGGEPNKQREKVRITQGLMRNEGTAGCRGDGGMKVRRRARGIEETQV